MDITPQQEEINGIKPFFKKWWACMLIVVAALIVLWLGVAWLRGWFPFSYRKQQQETQVPPVTQAELDSLTATGTPAVIPKSVMKKLTASGTPAVIPKSVLDSLTAKPKK